jgi:hypothetical protein
MAIVIDGIPLTPAQAMTVRVALCSMQMNMAEPDALGGDEHGRTMAAAYGERASEVLALIDAR